MQKQKSKGQKSQRQLQIGEQLKRVVADIFLQDDHFSIPGVYITVSQADVSPDAKNVKIFVSIFGKIDKKEKINLLKDLNDLAPYLRGKLSGKIELRYMPALLFVLDDVKDEAKKVEDIIESEAKKFRHC